VDSWTYGDGLPGPPIRVTAGDVLRVAFANDLPAPTSVHWHGLAIRNDMDGVPGVTQPPVVAGGRFDYEFTVPDPGTYWLRPHVGLQLDRGSTHR
jgi:FtsP/CotA-like multicopper oxidase with cupredoxin domain